MVLEIEDARCSCVAIKMEDLVPELAIGLVIETSHWSPVSELRSGQPRLYAIGRCVSDKCYPAHPGPADTPARVRVSNFDQHPEPHHSDTDRYKALYRQGNFPKAGHLVEDSQGGGAVTALRIENTTEQREEYYENRARTIRQQASFTKSKAQSGRRPAELTSSPNPGSRWPS